MKLTRREKMWVAAWCVGWFGLWYLAAMMWFGVGVFKT